MTASLMKCSVAVVGGLMIVTVMVTPVLATESGTPTAPSVEAICREYATELWTDRNDLETKLAQARAMNKLLEQRLRELTAPKPEVPSPPAPER